MSFFEDASLVLIPSAYKDQKVYSVKPTDGTGDLTFSRASSATRVQSDGLIEKVRTNVLLQSQTFDNASWAKDSATVTANATTAPDGTMTADKLIANSGYDPIVGDSSNLIQTTSIASNIYTFSVFAKSAEFTSIRFRETALVGSQLTVNLTNGTTSGGGAQFADTKVISVGNGWYRISFTTSAAITNTNKYCIRVANTGDGTSGIFIWGAQFEANDIATDYIATTTAAVSVGPVSGLPRLDYLDSTCPRLLLEPQRTNVAQYSEQIDNAYWTKSNLTITANQLASPDGSTNADLVTLAAGTSAKQFYSTAFTAITTAYSYSIFAKKGTHNFIQLLEGPTLTINFDLNLGTFNSVSGASGKMENYGNGWYRCTMFGTGAVTPVTIVNLIAVDSLNAVRGQATSSTGTFYVWGAQVEAGAYATSYIPTLGASVTRVADVASKTGISSLIGQTEGTLFVDFTINGLADYGTPISVNDGSTTNYIWLTIFANGTLRAELYNGAAQASITFFGPVVVGRYKMAFGYKTNDFVLYVNGALVGTDLTGTTFSGTTLSRVDTNLTNASVYSLASESINQTLLFKTRLTNAQLAELTA